MGKPSTNHPKSMFQASGSHFLGFWVFWLNFEDSRALKLQALEIIPGAHASTLRSVDRHKRIMTAEVSLEFT